MDMSDSYHQPHSSFRQLGLWPGSFNVIRREESVQARIRIGHSHLPHSFLFKKEDPAQCIACGCRLTNILFDCVDLLKLEIDI